MNFRSQYLAIYRLLLFLLAILVPIFSFTFAYVDPNEGGVLYLREIVTLLGIILLIGTYKSKTIRDHIQNIMVVLYIIVFLWQFTVLITHEFGHNNVLNFFIIATAVCVGFEKKKLLYWFLSCSFICTAIVVILFQKNFGEGLIFLMTLASIYTMILLVNLRKFSAEKQVISYANEVKEKNIEILDSIAYAKRIQSAILPSSKLIEDHLKDSFVFYKPKDIVAGDFYWLETKGNKVIFAVADCTGHGVPGAMISVICNNGLNRSVREYNLSNPGEILDKTRELIIGEFEKSEDDVKDGMDIALCTLENNQLQYAGAHNPLWVVRKDEIIELKANKQPVGKFDNLQPYTTHTLDLEIGDTLYLFTDGFHDQFGGKLGKKYKSVKFKSFLLSIQSLSMAAQLEKLDQEFESWKGELEQIDDVCVFGVRI
jgi:serine phosphatase RsbU (regulator of sigma subunit)